jgi:hypothetical protein
MKYSFAVGGMRGDVTRSDYSTLIIERSPSQKIPAGDLNQPKHLAQQKDGHAIAARADIRAST